MSNDIDNKIDTEQEKRNRRMGLIVLAAVFVPMSIAYLIFKTGLGIPTGTVNKGELLTPAQSISALSLMDETGQEVDVLAGKKKWRLLIPGYSSCDQACQQTLYVTRQVHVRLLEKAVRVQRYYLNVDSELAPETSDLFAKEHIKLKSVNIQAQQLQQLLAKTNLSAEPIAANRYFLMDQQGFIMMGYTEKQTGGELLKDLKRLLKYSYDDQ